MSAAPPSSIPPPIPVTYIAGFLGAGKTTLLNRLLPDPAFAGALVIVNEFGDIALDHALIEAAPDDMLLLPSGCLCCAVRGDLMATLEDLLRRRDNGRIQPFTRVVVEPTGLADPLSVLLLIVRHPYLKLRYRLDGVVTAVDAVNGLASLDNHPEAVRQAVLADRIVLSKTDLVADEETLAALRARLAALAPGVPILDAARGEVVPAALTGIGPLAAESRADALETWLGAAAAERQSEPHAGIRSFVLTAEEPVPGVQFDLFMDLVRSSQGPNLLRMKGILALREAPDRPVIVQAAQHLVHPPQQLPAWPGTDRTTRLVFIVRDIDPTFVAKLWEAFRADAPPQNRP